MELVAVVVQKAILEDRQKVTMLVQTLVMDTHAASAMRTLTA